MPGPAEIALSLFAAYRLARFDAGGLAYFNVSEAGFWRSFFAAVLVAPLYVVLLLMIFGHLSPAPQPWRFAAAEATAYVMSWVAFPLVVAALADAIDRRRRFIPYIVAYNWAAVLQNALLIPINMLNAWGVLPPQTGFLLWLAALAAICAYMWFIARVAFDVPPAGAAAIVALDLFLNIVISGIAKSLY
jgi:hypothetical protein